MKNEPTVRVTGKKSRRLRHRFRDSLRRAGGTPEQQIQPEIESINQLEQPIIELVKQQDGDGYQAENKRKSRENSLLRVLSHDGESMPVEQRAIILLQQSTFSEVFGLMKKYLVQNQPILKKAQFIRNAFTCIDAMIKQHYTKEVMKIFKGTHKSCNALFNVIQQSLGDDLRKEYESVMEAAYIDAKRMRKYAAQLNIGNIVESPGYKKRQHFLDSLMLQKMKRTASKKMGRIDDVLDLDDFINLKDFLNKNPKRSKMEQVAEFVAQDLLKINHAIIAQADVSLIKNENGLTTNALCSFSELFNRLTNMMAQQILSAPTEQGMMLWLTFYILVAHKAVEKMDYATAFAINNGLNQHAVDRLGIFEKLPVKIKNIKAELDELLTPSGNFKNLRTFDQVMLPPAISAKDMTSASEIELYCDDNTFNLRRNIVYSKALLPMMKLRSEILSDLENINKLLERRTDITYILNATQILEGETLFELSLQRRPLWPRTQSAPGPFELDQLNNEVAPPAYQSAPARIEDSDIIQKKLEERPSSDSKVFDLSALRAALSDSELGTKECVSVNSAKSHRECVKTLVLFFEEQSKSAKDFRVLKDETSDNNKCMSPSIK